MKYYIYIAAAFITLFLLKGIFLPEKAINTRSEKGDTVVILHGIARSSSHMQKLANHLAKAGYDVINLDYPSTDYKLEKLVESIHTDLSKKLTNKKTVHFVGYSMGGILTRALIHKHRPENLGRVVQLAAPNHGSEVADWLKDNYFFKKIYGPAGQQLITGQTAIKNLFGKIDYPLGIIAGKSSIDPISSYVIPGADDGKVSIKSTKLTGMKEHIIIPASHMLFPRNKIVHAQTLYFLQQGTFKK
ncbi:MAG: esterase/lipase family protein [Alphaproteobacteria bacterium]